MSIDAAVPAGTAGQVLQAASAANTRCSGASIQRCQKRHCGGAVIGSLVRCETFTADS